MLSVVARIGGGLAGAGLVAGLVVGLNGPEPEQFAALMSARGYGLADRVAPSYRTLADLLPATTYVHADGSTHPAGGLVVAGRVVEVATGPVAPPDPAAAAEENPDHPHPTVLARVEVHSAPGTDDPPDEVTVGFVYDDAASVAAWFDEAGEVVLFLYAGSPFFTDDPSIYAVSLDGAMLAEVAPDGTLSMPFTPDRVAEHLLRGVPTLAALEAAAAKPREVHLDDCGGIPCPADRGGPREMPVRSAGRVPILG